MVVRIPSRCGLRGQRAQDSATAERQRTGICCPLVNIFIF